MDLHEANMRLSSTGGANTPGGGPMVTQEMEGLNKTIEEQKKIIEEKQNAVAECEKKIKELEEKIKEKSNETQPQMNVRIKIQKVTYIVLHDTSKMTIIFVFQYIFSSKQLKFHSLRLIEL